MTHVFNWMMLIGFLLLGYGTIWGVYIAAAGLGLQLLNLARLLLLPGD